MSAFIIEDFMLQEHGKPIESRYDRLYNMPLTKRRFLTKGSEEQRGTVLEGSIKRIIDGDTVLLNLDNMPPVFRDISCRIRGIDAPELRRGRCCVEKCLAKVAKDYIEKLHPPGSAVIIISPQKGKYFRIIGNLTSNGRNTADILLKAGLAVGYGGSGERFNWCGDPKIRTIADAIKNYCKNCE